MSYQDNENFTDHPDYLTAMLAVLMAPVRYQGMPINETDAGEFEAMGKVHPTLYLAKKRIDLNLSKLNSIKIFK